MIFCSLMTVHAMKKQETTVTHQTSEGQTVTGNSEYRGATDGRSGKTCFTAMLAVNRTGLRRAKSGLSGNSLEFTLQRALEDAKKLTFDDRQPNPPAKTR